MPKGRNNVRNFGKVKVVLELPDLVKIQFDSIRDFLQLDTPPDKKENRGLQGVFKGIFPVEDVRGRYSLEFVSYSIGQPKFGEEEALERGATYSAPLRGVFKLIAKEKDGSPKDIIEQEVYLGELPLMTEKGTFIVNGVERVLVNQFRRAPGIYFEEEIHPKGKRLFTCEVIPFRGPWIEVTTDINDLIYVNLDKRHRFFVTILFKALGYTSPASILSLLFNTKSVPIKDAVSRILAEDVEKEGIVLEVAGKKITEELVLHLYSQGIKKIKVLEGKDFSLVLNTLERDKIESKEDALRRIYYLLRGTNPQSIEVAESYIRNSYFSTQRFDLSRVGRYKINKRLSLNIEDTTLTKDDFIAAVKYLLLLASGKGITDDVDHLGNRHLRRVGELLYEQFRIALSRLAWTIGERMTLRDPKHFTPRDLVNVRLISNTLMSFFATSQLSQFMEQVNPLAELTHKRRLSKLGPGGLTRKTAGLEVRDVHHSHYGRVCPIETPEGQNIGIITSLATYAKVNEYGFIETPYRKVVNSKVANEIVYLTADEEDKFTIAQASTPIDDKGNIVPERILARRKGTYPVVSPDEIDLMDISPKQLVSVSTALIPFLEHDDANRALMGSNMQRQAVPLLCPEAPTVGTGLEDKVARDSRAVAWAKRAGKVVEVDSEHVVIKAKDGDALDYYRLTKFKRTNQDTCVNQRPIVKEKDEIEDGDVIADGAATSGGELALGRNILVAFMPWRGYNFEDAIIISEKLLKDDVFTSVHIEEFEIEVRDTKLGPETITRELPNISEELVKNLDENGVIRTGAHVEPDDILVGKVSPKGETELTPEERLLKAIFGEKAADVKDSSLRVPAGTSGVVVDVKILSRESGDELPHGVLQVVKVYVGGRRNITIGDKLSGRHGNKGTIAKIVPEEDMPYLSDGTPVDMVLNPLGVPSRMNVGQILETHLGWAAKKLGVRVVTPVFEGATVDEIKSMLKEAELPDDGKTVLYDGKTGEPFLEKVTVGYIYMMKLVHMVEDKIHARAIGSYSLITQQPLGGKAQFGGQRFGEMEVWALEAYGAAHLLQEMLTVKSDDIIGRKRLYEALIRGDNPPSPGLPASFGVFLRELNGLCLETELSMEGKSEI